MSFQLGSCKCPTKPGTANTTSTFYLTYTVEYTYDVDQIKPLMMGTLAAPSCK